MKPIHIFKTGKHTDSHNQTIDFTEAHLAASVAAYDPALHQAPIVVGHPKSDDPAFGWVAALSASNGNMYATSEQVNADFSEQVRGGAFKKVSASFYPPNSPNNPVKGTYYLRHVGFLGAEPPAIKGLEPVEFGESDDDVLTMELDFSESASVDTTGIRKLFGSFMAWLNTADHDFNEFDENELDENANASTDKLTTNPATPTETDKDKDMGDQDQQTTTQADVQAKDDRIAELEKQLDEKNKADAKAKADALAKENADFAEGLVDDGKLAPKDKQMVTAILDGLDTADSVKPVEFGEGDDKQSLKQALKDKLATANTDTFSYLFSEAASKPTNKAVEFDAPQGTAVDADRLALHNDAIEYAEAHDVSYEVAITMVNA